jgi:hypothetical protein
MTGNEYADLIAAYVLKNHGPRGVSVYREVSLGRTIIGKNRHIDIFVVHPGTTKALAIECKYQDSTGTVDEKIPYALEDLRVMGMPVCLTYAGSGFSPGILHMLAASPLAAYCMPVEPLAPNRETRELDIALAMSFGWWDIIINGKLPFDPTRRRRMSDPTPE